MQAMSENPLVKSIFVVFMFWYALLFLVSGTNWLLYPIAIGWSVVIVACGALLSIAVVVMAHTMGFDLKRVMLTPRSDFRGATLTIGALPHVVPPPRTGNGNDVLATLPFWPKFKANHPKHATLMVAAAEIMLKAGLPASPVPGGHGGASLIEHSLNVVRMMHKLLPDWKYEGHRNRKGEIVFPLMDMSTTCHTFEPSDPMPIVSAFVHDIGKVACYVPIGDGLVKEVLERHDREGARLLRRIPELWDLPRDDVVALLLAVGYYHGTAGMPASLWIVDYHRSLTELLHFVDDQTGIAESGGVENATQAPAQAPAPDSTVVPVVAAGAPPPAAAPSKPSQRNEPAGGTDSGAGDGEDDEEDGWMAPEPPVVRPDAPPSVEYDQFLAEIMKPNRINGRNSSERVAYKYGRWMYVTEAKLRKRVAESTGDASLEEAPRGQLNPWTRNLMEALHARRMLKVEHDGKVWTPKRAIFNTVSQVDGHPDRETRFVIVIDLTELPALAKLPDCLAAPKIVKNSWGDKIATDLSAGRASFADVDADELALPPAASGEDETPPETGDTAVADVADETDGEPESDGEEESVAMAAGGGAPELDEMPLDLPLATTNEMPEPAAGPLSAMLDELPLDDLPLDAVSEPADQASADDAEPIRVFEALRDVAAGRIEGPPFQVRKFNDRERALFERDVVLARYPSLSLDDLPDWVAITTGKSGKDFICISLSQKEPSINQKEE